MFDRNYLMSIRYGVSSCNNRRSASRMLKGGKGGKGGVKNVEIEEENDHGSNTSVSDEDDYESQPIVTDELIKLMEAQQQQDESTYELCSVRLATYDLWPKFFHITAEELARAGFIYVGKSDLVRCFSCNLKLCDWKSTDVPLDEHQKYSPHCMFVKETWCRSKPKVQNSNMLVKQIFSGLLDLCFDVGHRDSEEFEDQSVQDKNFGVSIKKPVVILNRNKLCGDGNVGSKKKKGNRKG